MIIIPSSSSEMLAHNVSKIVNCKISEVERKRFPDGEMYVRIAANVQYEDVVVIGNTRTDADFIELLLLLNASKEGGAKAVVAVIPFFGYSRQHRIYKPGEPISSKVMTRSVEEFCDRIITVELHDPETVSFATVPFENLSIIDTMGKFFEKKGVDMVISPDDGGFERAREIARIVGVPAYYIDKKRIDPVTVEMHLPNVDFNHKSVLLADDIISSGGTIIKAVKLLRAGGASRISVSAVHGIFAKESDKSISSLVEEVVVSDTLNTPYSQISVAWNIAESLARGE